MVDGLAIELLLLFLGAHVARWLLEIALLRSVLVVGHFVIRELALIDAASTVDELLDVILGGNKHFLDRIGLHTDRSFNLFLRQIQPKLLKHFDVQGVPVVGLLADGVRLAVVVHVDILRKGVLYYFS